MARRHWIIKSEPFKYAWARLVADGQTSWDGVRSFEARNNLRAMSVGDLALFYHSNEGREIVGVAQIVRAAYRDPGSDGDSDGDSDGGSNGDWSAVDVAPLMPLVRAVTLETIKRDAKLSEMALVRRSRLSVAPVEPREFSRVLALGRTKIDRA